ncbi:MAG: hypothetical protein JW932_19600 [Deltaproteobacteria bacterium]|nr:hypothetical protein [Deltaproteobacteria bacterium]
MKIHEVQGPVSSHIDKQTSRKKTASGNFQSIMEQLTTPSGETRRVNKTNEGMGPILSGVQILNGVENKTPSMASTQKNELLKSLYETLDMVDFYAARLADDSIPIHDLDPLMDHLEGRLDFLREMEAMPGIPGTLKSVITDLSITLGKEITRFKRGDYA